MAKEAGINRRLLDRPGHNDQDQEKEILNKE